MAFSQRDLDRGRLKSGVISEGERFIPARPNMESMDTDSEREDQRKSLVKLIESGQAYITKRFTRDTHYPYLWNTSIVEKDSTLISLNFESEEDFFNWCSETASSFDETARSFDDNECRDVKDVELWLEGSPGALICYHREGSFNLPPETVALCLHVANVISVSCFLFCLRIGTFEDGNGSVIDKSRLIDHLLSLSDKWTWCEEECMMTFQKWIGYVGAEVDPSKMEEALKLLYQWILWPLKIVLNIVQREMDGAPGHGYAEVERVTKWGNEVCVFLEELQKLFSTSKDAQFLHGEISICYGRTAELHHILGNHERKMELLEMLKQALQYVKDKKLKVTELGPRKIEYRDLELIDEHILSISYRLFAWENDDDRARNFNSYKTVPRSDFQISRLSESRSKQIEKEWPGGSIDVETHKRKFTKLPHDQQVEIIIYMIENNRCSEARMFFEQIDLKHRGAELRYFFEFLNTPEIKLFLNPGISPEELESLCERQELLLDVSEGLLDDRDLTAKLLQQYAKMIDIRWNHQYQQILGACGDNEENAISQTYLWLKKELNLQLTLPMPECIQAAVSCLRDPCESGEHKRDNLSDTLKTYRCLKRSIDIFSELLQSWSTQGTSSEGEWLKLLETQKSVHDSILCFLFEMIKMCSLIRMALESNDSGADNGLKGLVGSNDSNILVYRELEGAFIASTLVWVERGRARTLLTQLGPWYNMGHGGGNPGSLKEELSEFDKDEQAAFLSIQSCTSACKRQTLFIEYAIQANEAYNRPEVFDPKLMVFMTNEQGAVEYCRDVSNRSEASNGRFDKQVEKLLDEFYEFYKEWAKKQRPVEDMGGVHRVLEELYDLLIEPLSRSSMFTQLDPKVTIVIVPDKMLYRVPFALLRDKRSQKYLFQLHPIAISPSLRVLQHCERRLRELEKSPLKPDGSILAIGNVAYDDPRDFLPGTKEELKHLHSTFPGRVQTLEGSEATPGKFLELVKEVSRTEEEHVFAFIHLGVHGLWTPKSKTELGKDDDEGEKQHKTGSLRFAPVRGLANRSSKEPTTGLSSLDVVTRQSQAAESEKGLRSEAQSSSVGEIRHASAFGEVGAVSRAPDGYRSSSAGDMLSSEDIIKGGFQWRTRLVVLSACNTSRGQGYSDGEVNLPRAMMIAGVPAAVVSQWKISDNGSPRLIKAFYEHMQRGQDVATALQSAMSQLLSDGPESEKRIFEWGPFLAWGLPTVQLPKEMLTVTARKALSVKRRAEMLRCEYNRVKYTENAKVILLKALETVTNVLEAVHIDFAIEDEAIAAAIIAVQRLLHLSGDVLPHIHGEHVQFAEEFFILLPFERLETIELELEKLTASDFNPLCNFRHTMIYTQAMKGNYQIALDYVNKTQACEEHGNDISRALNAGVILRLMGEYEAALRAFDDVLEYGVDFYECLIQTSYLKYLMGDRSGALEYARRAKKYENPEFNKPGYGAFQLSYKALPDEYYRWLLNGVVDDTGASSSRIWDSLPSQLPKEPTWREIANQHIEMLRLKFNKLEDITWKVKGLKALNAVDDILALVDNACVLIKENMMSAIIAIEHLLAFYQMPYVSEEVIALGENFYKILPIEQASHINLELEKHWSKHHHCMMLKFRLHWMYTLAMKGNHHTALEFANKMFEDAQNAIICSKCPNEGLVRQEKAVVLRLMGKHDEALKQFEEELAHGEDYDCLVQTSYLKHLMRDQKGALEYALRAKIVEDVYIGNKDEAGYGAFILAVKTLPDEYRQWLLSDLTQKLT